MNNNIPDTQPKDAGLREAVARRTRRCPQMPADLNERLMERVEEVRPQHSSPLHRWMWPSIAACIVAALIVGYSLLGGSSEVAPTASTQGTQVIYASATDLRDRLGLTIMFIAHDLSVVKYFSDRIGVMYFGKMVELADSDELFKNPLHPYTRSLLSAIPLPDPVYEKQRTRITYNPLAEHDYSVDTPTFREVTPGHFVYCNDAEEEKYKQMIK